jgi:outer membrane protein assembly factor BamD
MLAEKEYETGLHYYKKGALPAAEGRFAYVAQQYPLFSAADEALWDAADAFRKMGDRFENQEADALTKIVRDYPISIHVAAAKSRLTEMKRPVPDADPAAYARMKYNLEHRTHEGLFSRALGTISGRPDMGAAAKDGAPIMTEARPPVPVSVPMEAASTVAPGTGANGGGASDIGIGVATNSSALDQKTDARIAPPADGEHKASVGSSGISTDATAAPAQPIQGPLPTNRTKKELDEYKKRVDAATALQKKAAEAMAKKCAKTPTATGCATTPAPAAPPAPGATVPAATPPGAAAPATVPPAVKQ